MKTIYIKRADAINTILGAMTNGENNAEEIFNTALRKAASRMYNILPEDVVEVVRCEECAHCDDKTPYELWCLGRGWPHQMVPPDGFCDRGKRRPDA